MEISSVIKQGIIPRASSCRMMLETIKQYTDLTDEQLADFLEIKPENIKDCYSDIPEDSLLSKIKNFYLHIHLFHR